MERMEQRLDDEMAARAEQQRRAEEAETRAHALQDEVSSLRASHDSLALQAAHSQLASQAEEVLLAELSATRKSLAEAEGARQAEAARATQVTQENARMASELKKAAASAAKGDVLASDLSTLSSAVDRLRRQVADQLLKPVRALSKDNVTGRQGELVNQATGVANELAEAAAKLRNVMHTHLTPEQMMHVGISPNAMQTAQAAAQAQAASAQSAQP
jgi:outer membrane murein-binding lipoprotein Lpp